MGERTAEILEAIGEILARELERTNPAPLRPEDELVRDLMLDSLGLTVLAVGLEDRFRVRLSEEDMFGVRTAGELAARLTAHLAARLEAPPRADADVPLDTTADAGPGATADAGRDTVAGSEAGAGAAP